MDDASSVFSELEQEFCPPLDPALFVAIVGDYDLNDQSAVKQLRETLDALKTSADEQEDALFDPSGTSGFDFLDDAEGITSANSESLTLASHDTNTTSLGSNFSSLSAETSSVSGSRTASLNGGPRQTGDQTTAIKGLRTSNAEDQATYLSEMFSSIDRFTITHTLEKYNGDLDRSMDVLLNLSFFESSQISDTEDGQISIPKGIEGFQHTHSNGNARRKAKKNKNRQQQQQQASRPGMTHTPSAPSDRSGRLVENRWDNGKKDMDFICSRTILSIQPVSSAYHLNGASLPATIRALAKTEAKKCSEQNLDDPVTLAQIAELQEEFSSIPPTELAGLLKLTRNCISAANELARVMADAPIPNPMQPVEFKFAPQPTPLQNNTNRTAIRTLPVAPAGTRPHRNYAASRALAESHLIASQQAFEKANSAYRRGKSDHLMGGAAGYYSSVGREHYEKAKKESAIAADALVFSQSTSNTLDLHGVSVQDAVRIAREAVEAWWESLGEEKYANPSRGRGQRSYRVVTGLGRHSKDGNAKLGPAVGKCLAREGWKVEVQGGALIVTGLLGYR